MLAMHILETARLIIRPFKHDDLEIVHAILDIDLSGAPQGDEGEKMLAERRLWLQWTVLNYDQLARLNQPPYGDRAVVLKGTGELIGAVGYVPCLDNFGQLPYFANLYREIETPTGDGSSVDRHHRTTELGLFYAIASAYQGQGLATEAAHAMVEYAFKELKLKRIVATTSYENKASAAVMRRLGMHLEMNPFPDPPWLQVVGILESPV